MPNPGKFITIEGGDGVGKTTQRQRLSDRLRAEGYEVVETFEPGSTRRGRAIRELITNPELKQINEHLGQDAISYFDERELILLFYAARYEHVRTVIAPALAAGKWVICDRYIDSTRVYQGKNSELRALINELEKPLRSEHWPLLTLVLLVDPETAQRRVVMRRAANSAQPSEAQPTEIESVSLNLFQTQHELFSRLCTVESEPASQLRPETRKRCMAVCADASPDAVEKSIWELVSNRFNLRVDVDRG